MVRQSTIIAGPDGVIRRWDDEPAQILGYSSEEAIGQNVTLIIPPVFHERHWRGFNKAVSTGRLKKPGKELKVPAVHKSGAIRAVKGTLALDKAADGTVDSVTLTVAGQSPAWAPPLWRAVLGVLRAGQGVGGITRGGRG
jgi:PAS domain S-box-containing protein